MARLIPSPAPRGRSVRFSYTKLLQVSVGLRCVPFSAVDPVPLWPLDSFVIRLSNDSLAIPSKAVEVVRSRHAEGECRDAHAAKVSGANMLARYRPTEATAGQPQTFWRCKRHKWQRRRAVARNSHSGFHYFGVFFFFLYKYLMYKTVTLYQFQIVAMYACMYVPGLG